MPQNDDASPLTEPEAEPEAVPEAMPEAEPEAEPVVEPKAEPEVEPEAAPCPTERGADPLSLSNNHGLANITSSGNLLSCI